MIPDSEFDATVVRRLLETAAGSLACALIAGPVFIRFLKSRFRERIHSDSAKLNELHAAKKNTPTMGGLLIVFSVFLSLTADTFRYQSAIHGGLLTVTVLTTIALTLIGTLDDWIKIRSSRKGLTVRQKFLLQWIVGLSAASGLWILRTHLSAGSSARLTYAAGWYFVPWAAFVIVATSNAVNLTDGLDGLAAGCTLITAATMAIITAVMKTAVSPQMTSTGQHSAIHQQSAVALAAVCGSAAGFLWFNRHPAKVFMGDAGSLPLGGLLAVSALATGTEFFLACCGAVFLAETVSVMLQVGWYKRTGRRILLCSPLHNHFVFRGISETRIVLAFWILAAVASVVTLLCVRALHFS